MDTPTGPDIDRVRETLRERDEQVTGPQEDEDTDVADREEHPRPDPDVPGREDIGEG
jgi:hypothetical protein